MYFFSSRCSKKAQDAGKSSVATDNAVSVRFGQVFPGDIGGNSGTLGIFQKPGLKAPVAGFGPGHHGSFSEAHGFIGYDEVHIQRDGVAETLAFGAGAERVVEGKKPWLRLFIGNAAGLAFKTFAEDEPRTGGMAEPSNLRVFGADPVLHAGRILARQQNLDASVCLPSADFQGVDQTLAHVRPDHEAIHDNIDLRVGRALQGLRSCGAVPTDFGCQSEGAGIPVAASRGAL